jgi:hypothetical protein
MFPLVAYASSIAFSYASAVAQVLRLRLLCLAPVLLAYFFEAVG